jgi:hypothetical protein
MGLFLRDLALLAILLSGLAYDDMESYPDGAPLNGLSGGNFPGAYVEHGPGILALDTMETYTDGTPLNGLNGGLGFTGPYAERINWFGVQAIDTMESYADGAALHGLNGGTNWAGAYVDR